MTNKYPVGIDIFSGAGGLAEGFLAAGINVAVAVEKHPHAALTHAFNHPTTTVLCGDICDLTRATIKAQVKRRTGSSRIDIVSGGPPCQGFSPAGKQNQRDPRNQLIHEFVRVVAELLPTCFVFENVPAITDVSDGRVIRRTLDDFWNLGYRIYGIDNDSDYYPDSYPIVDSSWFGVPQKRKRLILVGWRKYFRRFSWLGTNGAIPASRRAKKVTIWDAIGDLDFLKAGYECHSYRRKASTNYQVRRRANAERLFNHLATNHRAETVEMFRLFQPGDTVNSIPEERRTGKQRVRRFAKTDLSPAILALPDDYIHYSQDRIPTVRELARLQSFDDDYVFLGKRTTSDRKRRFDVPQYTQVGNAVPPLMAKALGRAIVNALGVDSIDMRDRYERHLRLRSLTGSSRYSGYGLSKRIQHDLGLLDILGDVLELDLGQSSSAAILNTHAVPWSVCPSRAA